MTNSEYNVDFCGNGLQNRDEMYSVLSPIAKMLKVHIKVSNPHNTTSQPEHEEGSLFIKFWSTPSHVYEKKYHRIFGIDLNSGQLDGLQATGNGIPLTDENGTIVAEIHEENLYILFDLPHGENVAQLLTKIMNEFLLYFNKSPEEKKEAQRVQDEKKSEEAKLFLRNMTVGQLEESIVESNRNIKSYDNSLLEYQERIIRTLHRRQEEMRRNKFLIERKEKANSEMSDVLYKQLINLSATSFISVFEGGIYIPVGQIDVEFKGKIYDIGEFTIIIYPNGDKGGVRCINETRIVNRYYHPHVESDGDCCLGNISQGIAKLIGETEYAVAVTMMVEFLKTVYPDGWHYSVEYWPVRGEPEKEPEDSD